MMQQSIELHKFIEDPQQESFTSEETMKITKLVIGSMLHDKLNETELLNFFEVIYDLMGYASLDGFQEGLKVSASIIRQIK